MKYSYNQSFSKAWIGVFACTNYFCESNCDCGMTFDEAKEMVVEFYRNRLEQVEGMTEDNWYEI